MDNTENKQVYLPSTCNGKCLTHILNNLQVKIKKATLARRLPEVASLKAKAGLITRYQTWKQLAVKHPEFSSSAMKLYQAILDSHVYISDDEGTSAPAVEIKIKKTDAKKIGYSVSCYSKILISRRKRSHSQGSSITFVEQGFPPIKKEEEEAMAPRDAADAASSTSTDSTDNAVTTRRPIGGEPRIGPKQRICPRYPDREKTSTPQ